MPLPTLPQRRPPAAAAAPAPGAGAGAEVRPLVLVPAYNHAPALGAVLAGLPLETPVLVVDDGSTDATAAVVAAAAAERSGGGSGGGSGGDLFRLAHGTNRGKAAALHTGFAWAMARGFTHALTLDADGQHDPSMIPALLHSARAQPRALVLGVRPKRLPGTPRRSATGRWLSDRAVHAACGLRVSDSQTGMRVYPLALVVRAGCTASRFGFETEVIVRSVRLGARVLEVPAGGRYFVPTGRVSHFRPLADTLRGVRLAARLVAGRLRRPGDRVSEAPAVGP